MESNPIEYYKTCSLEELFSYIKKCNDYYFNNETSLISDSLYDTLKDILEERDPENKLLTEIGAPVNQNSVKMPYYMGSIDKIKTADSISKFHKKRNCDFVLSDKLDGTSALYIREQGVSKLYKRGDRINGRDISHLLKYMNLPESENLVIRGELIISKSNYEKYSDKFSNARSMINGISGSTININEDYLKLIDFVSFEILKPLMVPLKQFELLSTLGFKVPGTKIIPNNKLLENINDLPSSFLYNYLTNRREASCYDIDGIIITQNIDYELITKGNPSYSVAFKANSFGKVTKIKNIEWNVSKHGVLIPKIEFDPIELGGSNVKHCSGFNGKHIIDNELGPNAIIRVVLSGEIIPYIVEIIENTEPQMPSCEYKQEGINLLPINLTNNIDLLVKRFTHFFKTLKIENMGEGIIRKLINANYNTLDSILNASKEDLLSIPGFKETLAQKIYNNIHNVIDKPIRAELLMVSSLCFGHGFGVRKMKIITDHYIHIHNMFDLSKEDILKLDGFEEKTTNKFMEGIPKFKQFMEDHPYLKITKIRKILVKKQSQTQGKLNKEKFVFTGFRDDDLVSKIESHGGTIQPSINKSTTILVVKDKEATSSKITKAKQMNIKVLTRDELNI